MPFGLLTGHAAARFLGTLDVITALGSRVIGSLRVTAGMQSVTAVLFLVIFVATGATIPTEPASIALAVLLGLDRGRCLPLVFHGSPVGLDRGRQWHGRGVRRADGRPGGGRHGESSSPLQAFGALVATVGVLLTALAFDGGLRATRFAGRASSSPSSCSCSLVHGDDHRRGSRDDVLDQMHDRQGRERVDRHRGRAGPGAARGERARPSTRGRSHLVEPAHRRGAGRLLESSTSWDSSPLRSGSRPLRRGWSDWQRRSVRRSPSWSPSRSSASDCDRFSGSGCSGLYDRDVCIAVP